MCPLDKKRGSSNGLRRGKRKNRVRAAKEKK